MWSWKYGQEEIEVISSLMPEWAGPSCFACDLPPHPDHYPHMFIRREDMMDRIVGVWWTPGDGWITEPGNMIPGRFTGNEICPGETWDVLCAKTRPGGTWLTPRCMMKPHPLGFPHLHSCIDNRVAWRQGSLRKYIIDGIWWESEDWYHVPSPS